jgi:hypothetical protein
MSSVAVEHSDTDNHKIGERAVPAGAALFLCTNCVIYIVQHARKMRARSWRRKNFFNFETHAPTFA